MLPGDRLICVFVEPKGLGFSFKDWLLHVTIVPWFRLDSENENIVEDLKTALQTIKPFPVTMGRENVGFGHQKSKKATIVQQPTQLTEVENKVREYFHTRHAWLVDETTKRARTSKPHITNQKNSSMHEGDLFTCDRLYIVEQKGGVKEIVGEVRLG